MTKDEIIAELRRSATEDAAPFREVHDFAFDEVIEWKDNGQRQFIGSFNDDCRTFFLLVAEALETT